MSVDELLPNSGKTSSSSDKIRRKIRKYLTLSCGSQDRYLKKFVKRLEKEYSSLVSSCSRLQDTLGSCSRLQGGLSSCMTASSASSSSGGSTTTSTLSGGSSDGSSGSSNWCTLAYWEERTRVGRQFPVSTPSVQVFNRLARLDPDTQGLCLHTISARDNARANQSIVKAREKIGLGIILSISGSTVSVYNRSDIPLFVNSPTLDTPNSRTFSVFKIQPGYSMKVFDFVTSRNLERLQAASGSSRLQQDGPYDPHAIRLSFGKGWGGKYSRQIVTSCPCWLEILLVPPR